jgi:hypothetical protein
MAKAIMKGMKGYTKAMKKSMKVTAKDLVRNKNGKVVSKNNHVFCTLLAKARTWARKGKGLAGGKGGKRARRLLLVLDTVLDYERIIQAALDNVTIVPVRWADWNLSDLNKAIENRCGPPAHQFQSIGILGHGAEGRFQLLKKADSKRGGVDLPDLAKNQDLRSFFKHLAKYVQKPRDVTNWKSDSRCRIDLMGCCVARNEEGKALIEDLESLTRTNWTASINETGDAGDAADWVMETEKKLGSIAPCYFRVQRLKSWRGTLDNNNSKTANVISM